MRRLDEHTTGECAAAALSAESLARHVEVQRGYRYAALFADLRLAWYSMLRGAKGRLTRRKPSHPLVLLVTVTFVAIVPV
jgi:hypothetical protein